MKEELTIMLVYWIQGPCLSVVVKHCLFLCLYLNKNVNLDSLHSMLQIFRLLQSWGLHSSGMWCLISLGDWYLIFQDSVVVSSQRVKKSKNFPWTFQPFKMRPLPSLKKSGTNTRMTQHYIPEEKKLCSAFFKPVIVLDYAYSTTELMILLWLLVSG